MSLTFVGKMNVPTYTALSTDISDSKIVGASIVGGTVFTTDDFAWHIIKSDLTLGDYVLPVQITVSTDTIDIGAVHIDQQLSESTEVSPGYNTKSVAVPGTSEALTGTDVFALSLYVFPKPANVGTVYFGTSGVDKTTSQQIIIPKGTQGISIDAPLAFKLNLADFYIDCEAGNAGDGVNFFYVG